MHTLRIDPPLLLPEVPDERGACVARLQALLSLRRGILQTHVRDVDGKPELCLHYDPALISGEEVRQLASRPAARRAVPAALSGTDVIGKLGGRSPLCGTWS